MSAGQKLDMPIPTATVARVGKRSCADLALCQSRTPPCTLADGKTPACPQALRFAPGVIEGHKVGFLGTPAQRRELVRYLRQLAGWGAVLVVGGLFVGLISGAL